MIRHDQRHAVVAVHLTAQLADRELRVEKSLRRERAERDDDLRPDQLDLPHEIRAARRPPRRAVGLRLPGGRCLRTLQMNTSSRRKLMAARILVSSWPAWPTNGSPRSSSFAPGASPTHMRSASGSPSPGTGFVRRRVERAARARRDDVGDLLRATSSFAGGIAEQRAARSADHEPGAEHASSGEAAVLACLRGRNVHGVRRRLRRRLRIGSSGHRLLSLDGVQSGRTFRRRRRPRGSPAASPRSPVALRTRPARRLRRCRRRVARAHRPSRRAARARPRRSSNRARAPTRPGRGAARGSVAAAL